MSDKMVQIESPVRKASFEANTLRQLAGANHRLLITLFNLTHEAVENEDFEQISVYEKLIGPIFEEFDRVEVNTTPNPSWLRCKMKAGWNVATCDYETAYQYELQGYYHTASEPDSEDSRRRKAVSASNLADQLIRLDRPHEALPFSRESVILWDDNSINHLVHAKALYACGYLAEAEKVFAELLKIADFDNDRDVLANCMSYEKDLHDMRDLVSVSTILKKIEMSCQPEVKI